MAVKFTDSYNDLIKSTYQNGGSLKKFAKHIGESSARMLNRAKIVKNIDKAVLIRSLIDDYISKSKDPGNKLLSTYMLLMDYHDSLVDEVIIISAFELYAKAILMTKGYFVYVINSPSDLHHEQKKRPIHRLEYRHLVKSGKLVNFSGNTISASILLGKNYQKTLNVSDHLIHELNKINKRRNFVHFTTSYGYTLDKHLFSAIQEIKQLIEKKFG